jgi:predicted CopG family antitoxin
MFQLSQENEDLRERLAVLEEYSGKDSLVEVRQLVKEKKELAGRVKALEETSQNWAAF